LISDAYEIINPARFLGKKPDWLCLHEPIFKARPHPLGAKSIDTAETTAD